MSPGGWSWPAPSWSSGMASLVGIDTYLGPPAPPVRGDARCDRPGRGRPRAAPAAARRWPSDAPARATGRPGDRARRSCRRRSVHFRRVGVLRTDGPERGQLPDGRTWARREPWRDLFDTRDEMGLMPIFPLNKEVAVSTPTVTFEGTDGNRQLAAGVHLFQLIVEDGDKIPSHYRSRRARRRPRPTRRLGPRGGSGDHEREVRPRRLVIHSDRADRELPLDLSRQGPGVSAGPPGNAPSEEEAPRVGTDRRPPGDPSAGRPAAVRYRPDARARRLHGRAVVPPLRGWPGCSPTFTARGPSRAWRSCGSRRSRRAGRSRRRRRCGSSPGWRLDGSDGWSRCRATSACGSTVGISSSPPRHSPRPSSRRPAADRA